VAVKLVFYGWRRSGIYKSVSGPALTAEGRLSGSVNLTLKNTEPPHESVSGTVAFDVTGPGDVRGLRSKSVTRVVPPPGTKDAETDKCVFVDLAAADLPWRYSPRLASGRVLPPWLVLVVGTTAEIQFQPGNKVTLTAAVLAAHDLARSARWAHVQEDAAHPGQRIARLLCERPLLGATEYLAVVVPAFTATGQAAWTTTTPSVTLPRYYSWQFHTGEAGDFASLAGRLRPGKAPAGLGRAPLHYTPLPPAPPLSVRGALAPVGAADDPLPQAVADDVTALTTPLVDPRRPVVGLPVYGAPWVADPTATAWGAVFRHDPRHRGAAGLGVWTAIEAQDHLSDAAAAQAGALHLASQRIRHLTAGLAAARSLWERRRPRDPLRRLTLLGPSLGRTMTKNGVALDLITGPGRPLPRTIFSGAARRVLRRGPARAKWAAPDATDPGKVVVVANTCPPPPPLAPFGLPHSDALARATGTVPLEQALAEAMQQKQLSVTGLKALMDLFDRTPYPADVLRQFDQTMATILDRAANGQPVPLFALVDLLDPLDGRKQPSTDELPAILAQLLEQPGDDLFEGGEGGEEPPLPPIPDKPPDRPCRPFPDQLPTEVDKTVDPTGRPVVVDRVLGTIQGLDDQPLTPPEICPDLDLPAWQLLRDHDPDWLLPGVEQLADDSVVSVQTNPVFVDAFLLGLNAEILGELRFRNLPIVSGCTPFRQFWALANPTTGTFEDDIEGVHRWPAASPLGSAAHRPAGSVGSDLVVVFRTSLFRRYPRTLLYLTPAPIKDGKPDWAAQPDLTKRRLPSFQGTITADICYFAFDLQPALGAVHWVVLEEPPHGLSFFNTAPPGSPRVQAMAAATDGATFADAAFADPLRVMLRGDALIPAGA
jgi:hypothetical protein